MPSQELLDGFAGLPAANIADTMGRSCAMNPRIRLMSGFQGIMVGPALTVKARAGDNLFLHQALDMAQPGDVIVLSNDEDTTRSIMGEIMFTYAKYQKKLGGLVIDGPVRDVDALQEMDLPVIIQFAPVHEVHNPLALMGPLMVDFAKKAKVPVCVHLDHGDSIDRVKFALSMGFTSVMYDGSTLPYEENVANTKLAAELAHAQGADIEAELGSMGKTESGEGVGSGEDDETKIYTDPVQAKDFVARTGVDALACSFGTTHGIYLKNPRLDFSVVENVRKETNGIPVVMHGGSGVSKEDFHAAIKAGVRKINYFTYMDRAAGIAVQKWAAELKEGVPPFYTSVTAVAKEAMKENVKEAMRTFARQD